MEEAEVSVEVFWAACCLEDCYAEVSVVVIRGITAATTDGPSLGHDSMDRYRKLNVIDDMYNC